MKKEKIDVLNEFREILADIQKNMRKLFRGETSEIAIIHGSIKLAQEALFQNLFEEGDKLLIIGKEHSASQLEYMAKLSHLTTQCICVNEEIPLETLSSYLQNDATIKAILIPLVEESTGVLYRLQGIQSIIQKHNILVIVSVDETLLMNPFYFDDAHVDVAISTLMNPIRKGQFSFIALSNRAQSHLLSSPRHFLNLKKLCCIEDAYYERELINMDSYKEVADILHLMAYYEMWQWNHYFGALTTYLRNSIQQIGYHVVPNRNYSNSHILIKLQDYEDAYSIRSRVYTRAKLIVEVQDEHTLIINMNHFMHIFDTLRLIDALCYCKDTVKRKGKFPKKS